MLKIYFLNVRHGDSIVVEYLYEGKKSYGVIDSNTVDGRTPALEKLQELGATSLSFVCLTHPDHDHYSGLLDILQTYRGNIESFYTFPIGDVLTRKKNIEKLSEDLIAVERNHDNNQMKNRTAEFLKILQFGITELADKWEDIVGGKSIFFPSGFQGVAFEMVQPPPRAKGPYLEYIRNKKVEDPGKALNNSVSLALRLTYKGKRVLLGGDATLENWRYHKQAYQKDGNDIFSDVVKLPHHGSKHECNTETMSDFFCPLATEKYGIVSANGNSHPNDEPIDWMLSNNVKPLCTNLLKRWMPHAPVVDFTTSGVSPQLASMIRQRTVDKGKYRPCKGNITVIVNNSGELLVETEYKRHCGCSANELAQDLLFTA